MSAECPPAPCADLIHVDGLQRLVEAVDDGGVLVLGLALAEDDALAVGVSRHAHPASSARRVSIVHSFPTQKPEFGSVQRCQTHAFGVASCIEMCNTAALMATLDSTSSAVAGFIAAVTGSVTHSVSAP